MNTERETQFSNTRVGSVDSRVVAEIGTVEPVTLVEAKNYLRINNTQDDLLITAMITNARRQAESYLNSDIVSKEREVFFSYLNEDVNLYYAPITSVDSLSIDGVVQVVDTAYETLGLDNPKVRLLQAPAEKVLVTYTTAGVNNDEIKIGVLALIAWLYYHRDAKMNTNWKAWLSPFKTYGYYGVR